MKKIVIVIGSFCYNRGSEALVRGTIEIVKKSIPDSKIVLCSGEENFGSHLNIKNVDTYVRRQSYYGALSFDRVMSNFFGKVLRNKELSDKIKYKYLLKECHDADLVIICGGDNYDKSYNMYNLMHSVNSAIRKTTKGKMLLYDCSLAEGEITDDTKKDFALFDAITAREEDTFNVFKRAFADIPVYYYPDPAFVMDCKETELPEIFDKGEVIGVNLSTMAVETQYGSDKNTVVKAYRNMIDAILSDTDKNVLFIPHVMRNLDLRVLKELYSYYSENERVALLSDETLNAPELKYIISHCCMYVGARTHSTIAAYSSCVPTLVLGYSVKSIGIAKDLFGDFSGYVVPVNTISKDNDGVLKSAFENMYKQRETIKKHLNEKMIEYKDKANAAGELFKSLSGGNDK